mmetsp:Transcript_14877/g.23683  ORF Transcript_14877/g.23683 Transcript_14877/m.23683 type:complete len:201 (-) Transcript_14877:144-746(-)
MRGKEEFGKELFFLAVFDALHISMIDTFVTHSSLFFWPTNSLFWLSWLVYHQMARDRFGTTPLDLGLKSYVQRYPVKHNKEFSWLCRHYDPEVSDMYYLSDEKLHEHKLKQESIQQERRESEAFSRRQNAIAKELEKRRKEEDTKREELEKQYSSAAMIAAQAAWEAARSRSTVVLFVIIIIAVHTLRCLKLNTAMIAPL